MAKDRSTPATEASAPPNSVAGALVDIHSLAGDLFARNFIPRHDHIQAWKVAADCYAAAQEFARVASLVNSGTNPNDIGPEVKPEPAVAEPTESPATSQ